MVRLESPPWRSSHFVNYPVDSDDRGVTLCVLAVVAGIPVQPDLGVDPMRNTTNAESRTLAMGIIGLAITLVPFVVVALLAFVPTYVK